MKSQPLLIVAVIFGLLGTFIMGYAVGVQNNMFTPDQLSYISGVAEGAKFQVLQSPSMDAHERCIREFYPDHQISLAGCLEALEEREWKLP